MLCLKLSKQIKQLKKGSGKVLTGIPMALKDLFCTKRMKTTCGSKMLANFHAPYEATIVTQIKRTRRNSAW